MGEPGRWPGHVAGSPTGAIEIGYSGSVICELKAGDEAYLRDLSNRIDRLLIQA